jgi:hypothetical protein
MPPESALASSRESADDWVSGPFDLSGDDDDGASTDDRESADDARVPDKSIERPERASPASRAANAADAAFDDDAGARAWMALCEEAMTGGFREREAWDDETTALLSRARRLARGGVRGEKAEEGKEKDDDDDDDDDDDGDDDAARPAREDENARRRSVSSLLRPQNIPPSAALVLVGVLLGVLLGVFAASTNAVPASSRSPSLRRVPRHTGPHTTAFAL